MQSRSSTLDVIEASRDAVLSRPAVVLLTQVVPYPLDSGPKIKTYRVLQALARRFDVVLVSYVRDEREAAALQSLRPLCCEVVGIPLRRSRWSDASHLTRALVAGRSFIVHRDARREMHTAVRQLIERQCPAAVHVDQLTMLQFVPGDVSARVVLDEHNAVWLVFKRLAEGERSLPRRIILEREWRRLHTYELQAIKRVDATLVVSESDRQALCSAASPDIWMEVIPIGLDMSATPMVDREASARDLLILGTMHWPPNSEGVLWFAQNVFPLIRERSPSTRLWVVGHKPPAAVRALAGQDSAIEVTGYVEDVLQYIQRSAAMVVPLLSGGGMRVKVLEALAWGLPLVSTTVGCEGIAVQDKREIRLADTSEAFATAALELIQQPDIGRRRAARGRELLQQHYDWSVISQQLNAFYDQLLSEQAVARSGQLAQHAKR